MGIENLLAQGVQIRPEGMERNALMQYQQFQDAKQKNALMQMQMQDMHAQRTMSLEDAQQKRQLMQMILGQTGMGGQQPQNPLGAANAATVAQTGNLSPTLANAGVQSAAMAQQPRQAQQQPGSTFGLPSQAVAMDMYFNGGKGLSKELMERSRPQMGVHNGIVMDLRNTPVGTTIPTISQDGKAAQPIKDDSAPGGWRITAPPGAVDTYAGFQNAGEKAKAQYDLQQVWDPKQQRTVLVTRQQAIDSASPAQSQPAPQPSQIAPGSRVDPRVQAQRDAARLEILNQELASAKTPQDRAAVAREISRMSPGIQNPNQAPPGPLAAGASTREKASAQSLELGNTSFMKDSFTPALDAGKSANDLLVSVTSARNAMRNLGATGFGTPHMATAASVLGALGVPQALRYAGNAQLFQSAAMERLFETLGAQKGPQTEGDADRAKQTFASLKNTPDANLYILDLAQAKAERDQMKASYYRDALPLAQQEGDLQKVDREWSRIAPSVFGMKSMKKWGMK